MICLPLFPAIFSNSPMMLNFTQIHLLQTDIDSLYDWSSNWMLNFSISKCKAMHVCKCHLNNCTYLMNNQPLPTICHLGVLVDNELNFHQHTASVIAKANRLLAIINKSFINLDTIMLHLLYKSLISSSCTWICKCCLGSFFLNWSSNVKESAKTCYLHGFKYKTLTLCLEPLTCHHFTIVAKGEIWF